MTMTPSAHWLFENHDPEHNTFRKGRNSEHFYTALFALLLFHLSSSSTKVRIPIRTVEESSDDNSWKYRAAGYLNCSGISFSSLWIETKLDKSTALDIFSLSEWPFNSLEPDIVVANALDSRFVLIENKTTRSNPGSIGSYVEAAAYLCSQGRGTDVYVLITGDHPNYEIWKIIKDRRLKIILWEEVFAIIDEDPFFRTFFNFDGFQLSSYYGSFIKKHCCN